MSIANLYDDNDALGLAELVRTGQVSASELLDEALDRVATRNPRINAVVVDVRSACARRDRGRVARGAIHRVRSSQGSRCRRRWRDHYVGSRFFADHRPRGRASSYCATNAPGLVNSARPTPRDGAQRRPSHCSSGRRAIRGISITRRRIEWGAAARLPPHPSRRACDGWRRLNSHTASSCGLFGLKPTAAVPGRPAAGEAGPAAKGMW